MTKSKFIFYWRWILSKKVRVATDLRHQAWKMLNAQRDILSASAIQEIQKALDHLDTAIHTQSSPADLEKAMQAVEKSANTWFKPYHSPGFRENIEVFLVAGAVALAVRTFFLQPMAIPTGSAQPTLWGITHENIETDQPIPGGVKKFYLSWIKGEKYYHKSAEESGEFRIIDSEPKRVFLFFKKQRFRIGNQVYTQWFPADSLWERTGLERANGAYFDKGEDIYKIKVHSGDHLFVNRMVYNFRQPHRGETIVFVSTGIRHLTQNTHYIKRLVGMGEERIRIGDDRHVVINDRRLDANDSGFEFVYSFTGPPEPDVYSGHVNQKVADLYSPVPMNVARGYPDEGFYGFPNGNYEYTIPKDQYMAFGDNTMNSYDSRAWGPFPKEKVIGRAGFVFWPITERFGWHRK